jgi:hypothetical protein
VLGRPFDHIILAFLTFSAAASAQSDSEQDLPSRGRSAFDHLIDDPKAAAGLTIPFPFSKLIDHLKAKLADPSHVSMLFFPFGRSLQKFAADPNYFKFPRTVVSVSGESKASGTALAVDYNSKLFIGYVEPTNQLEVISFNESLGRYEYQVIRDYQAGKTPRPFYVKRRLCLSCHESAVPIFPGEPWSESNDNNFIAENIIAARGGETRYFGQSIRLNNIPGRGFTEEALRFDGSVREATAIVYNQYRREQICPLQASDPIDCLAMAFTVSLANYYNYWNGPEWPPLVEFKRRVEQFYLEQRPLEIPFAFIPDRDPLTNNPINSMKDRTQPPANMKIGSMIALLKSNITYLQSFSDPKKSRKTIVAPVRERCVLPEKAQPKAYQKWCETSYFFDELSMNQLKIIESSATLEGTFDFRKIAEALQTMAARAKKNPQSSLASGKLNRALFYSELLSTLKKREPLTSCCGKPLAHRAEMALESKAMTQRTGEIKNAAVAKFMHYCSECHGNAGIEYPRQFLYAMNEVELVDGIRGFQPNILSCLENAETPMPPISSAENFALFKNPQDRQLMIDFFRK